MKILPARDADQSFILDSFTREYHSTPYCQGASFGTVRGLMFDLLASPRWTTLVMCDDELEDEILGYVVFREANHLPDAQQAIAWVHVKATYRRMGIASKLLAAACPYWQPAIWCAFLSPRVLKLTLKYNLTLRFRPYLIFDR